MCAHTSIRTGDCEWAHKGLLIALWSVVDCFRSVDGEGVMYERVDWKLHWLPDEIENQGVCMGVR